MGKKKTKKEPQGYSVFTDYDIHLFKAGDHFRLYEKFGAHAMEQNGRHGTFFSVWAPNAESVSVMGNFNSWQEGSHRLFPRWDESGIWEGFLEGIHQGEIYKYAIRTHTGERLEKADPYAFYCELPPKTASIVWTPQYAWQDEEWMRERKQSAGRSRPMSIYEVHAGSWRRNPEQGNRSLTYREMADELVRYVKDLGFTHVEFMPIMEHPFGGSWGYQITGYFAPTSRYGAPEDFMYLVDSLHQQGIGVILDWVPSHFPGDAHGLLRFDGTSLYEHVDPKLGFHPDWQSYIYNYGRREVRAFLISNALFWLDYYHVDGLRVDAVASMLYLDYSREAGEWIPNQYGGNENLEAIDFLKKFNETVYLNFPDVVTIAEESTAWTGVSRPTFIGGLGFGQKWMMGWMHDTLQYMKLDPVYRKHHQNEITFSIVYAFTENFLLPLSHDEVVYGKAALVAKMPGDEWQRFASLRLLFSYMYMHPGTKLIFMGGEFGETSEWNHDGSLHWHLLQYEVHKGVLHLVQTLNALYRKEHALFDFQFEDRGFEWVDYSDRDHSVMIFMRKGENEMDKLLVVCNFTPGTWTGYRVGVPVEGRWKEIFNSDAREFGGTGILNEGEHKTEEHSFHGRPYSLTITLPPLGVTVFKQV